MKSDGAILQEEVDENGKKSWRPFSKLGARKALLNDLSPAATYISSSYNTPADAKSIKSQIYQAIDTVEKKWGWMFETIHKNGEKGKINSVTWSDVFICPECSADIVFWENAVDIENGKVLDEFRACLETSAFIVTRRHVDKKRLCAAAKTREDCQTVPQRSDGQRMGACTSSPAPCFRRRSEAQNRPA